MDLREIGLGGMDWTDLAQDRDQWMVLVNTVMNFIYCILLCIKYLIIKIITVNTAL
jgi:hypothetical protein